MHPTGGIRIAKKEWFWKWAIYRVINLVLTHLRVTQIVRKTGFFSSTICLFQKQATNVGCLRWLYRFWMFSAVLSCQRLSRSGELTLPAMKVVNYGAWWLCPAVFRKQVCGVVSPTKMLWSSMVWWWSSLANSGSSIRSQALSHLEVGSVPALSF